GRQVEEERDIAHPVQIGLVLEGGDDHPGHRKQGDDEEWDEAGPDEEAADDSPAAGASRYEPAGRPALRPFGQRHAHRVPKWARRILSRAISSRARGSVSPSSSTSRCFPYRL